LSLPLHHCKLQSQWPIWLDRLHARCQSYDSLRRNKHLQILTFRRSGAAERAPTNGSISDSVR